MISFERLAIASLAVLLASAGPAAATLCDRLFVPEGYQLSCTVRGAGGAGSWQVVVRPEEGAFAALSELSLRRVDEPIADPASWLRAQLTLDFSAAEAALEELAQGDDSPIAGTRLAAQLMRWRSALDFAAAWPLESCTGPEHRAAGERWELACDWPLGPVHQYVVLRLVERDGARHLIEIRTMNERRLRHLVAIANSF